MRPTNHLVNQVEVLVPPKLFRVSFLLSTFSSDADHAESSSCHLAPEPPCLNPASIRDPLIEVFSVLDQILCEREDPAEAIVVIRGALQSIIGTNRHAHEKLDYCPIVDTSKDIVVVFNIVLVFVIAVVTSLLKVRLFLLSALSDQVGKSLN